MVTIMCNEQFTELLHVPNATAKPKLNVTRFVKTGPINIGTTIEIHFMA